MTEHDAPTIACATLWLDTSNETRTRSAECLDDCATLAFEKPAEHALACAAPARPAQTAVLDRAQLIAAIDSNETGSFESERSIASDRARPPIWRSVATHALAVVVGAAVSTALLATPRQQPAIARLAPRLEQRAPDAAPALPSPTKAPMHPEAPVPSAAPVEASLSDAVDALARGDYAAARAQYEALAREHPNDAALSAVAAILAARTSGPCTARAWKGGSCAR